MNTNIYIICSDRERNGKTLFARLFADCLSLRSGKLRIFDTDGPKGQLAYWFADNSEIVDLARTPDQMKLFDTMLEEPEFDYLVDLSARHFIRFFSIFSDIGFEAAAKVAGMEVAVLFMLDPSANSLQAAIDLRGKLRDSRLNVIRNEAIGDPLLMPGVEHAYYEIRFDREIILPALSETARAYIAQEDFTYSGLVLGRQVDVPIEIRSELWNFLEIIYNQRRASGSDQTWQL